MMQGEYVLNTFWSGTSMNGTCMERVWNGRPAQYHFSGIAFDGLERRSLEKNLGT